MNLEELRSKVLQDVCPVTGAMAVAESPERERRCRKASKYIDRFYGEMVGDDPFQSEEEAIQHLAPFAIWFIGWAARQFAIFVIKSLWKHFHKSDA